MSLIRKSIDAVNKLVQFEIKESCQSVCLVFEGSAIPTLNQLTATVELVSKNKRDEVLYRQKLSLVKQLLRQFVPNMGYILPLALDKNLKLSEDAYLRVTIVWEGTNPTSFGYKLNKVLGYTSVPLSIKEVRGGTIDTEYYPLLMVGAGVNSIDTVVMMEDVDGVLKPEKVSLNRNYIDSMRPYNEDSTAIKFLPLFVTQNQKVEIEGDVANYLINA